MQLCGQKIGLDQPLFLIAGPCVIESEKLALESAAALKTMAAECGILLILSLIHI